MLLSRHQGGKHLHRPLGPGENQKPKRRTAVIKVKKETEDSAQER